MNNKFFELPKERQELIINSAYKVFSQNSYKKAPVSEIAKEAGISKSLLFYHFKNKKELYTYLWQNSIEITRAQVAKHKVLAAEDFFEMLRRNLRGKCETIRRYPYLGEFSLRAYYEQDTEIRRLVQSSLDKEEDMAKQKVLLLLQQQEYFNGLNTNMLYQEMLWAADGYVHMAYLKGKPNPDTIEKDMKELIEFWETVYRRRTIS